MNTERSKLILLALFGGLFGISFYLYFLGWTTTSPDIPLIGIIAPSRIDVSASGTPYIVPAPETPVVVPAKDLHIVPTKHTHCVISGCSGEICASEEMMSNCIYRPEFACYKKATCEEQSSGKCGWTKTPELTQCQEAGGLTPIE